MYSSQGLKFYLHYNHCYYNHHYHYHLNLHQNHTNISPPPPLVLPSLSLLPSPQPLMPILSLPPPLQPLPKPPQHFTTATTISLPTTNTTIPPPTTFSLPYTFLLPLISPSICSSILTCKRETSKLNITR